MSTTTPSPRVDEPIPIALANTIWIDRAGVHDALADAGDLQLWVRAFGHRMNVLPAPGRAEVVSAGSRGRLTELRDAMRRLAAEHTRDPRTLGQSPVPDLSAAASIVNAASATSSVWPELCLDDRRFTRLNAWAGESFADALITMIAREAIDLITSPQWQQLRPCTAPGCAYYFVKELRREWCSAVCGNRARVARHAQRHRGNYATRNVARRKPPSNQ